MVAPNLITQFEYTQLHRDTYIAVLNSFLKTRGAKRRFANTIGITPQYLSNLLNPTGLHTPSQELAQHIADLAPIPSEDRKELLNHLRSANPRHFEDSKNSMMSEERLSPDQSRDVMLYINNYEYRVLYNTDTDQVRNAYNMLLKLGNWALARIDPRAQPYHYAGICASLNGTASTLNMPVNAMWYAQASLSTAQRIEYWSIEDREKHLVGALVNAWDGVAAAWHNLGMPHKAIECVEQAKHIVIHNASDEERARWIPMVAMEELNTYTIMPRFSIYAAESAMEWGLNMLYRSTDRHSSRSILAVLIERNMMESYIQHGSPRSLRKAQQHIIDTFSPEFLSSHGPLVQTMHLRTSARLHQKTHNHHEYTKSIHNAYQLSVDAGLIHQQAEIRQETGPQHS